MYQVAVGCALGQLPDSPYALGELQVRDRAGQRQSQPRPVGAGHRDGGRDGGTVPRSVFPARHAGLRSGGMGTVSDDIGPCESTQA